MSSLLRGKGFLLRAGRVTTSYIGNHPTFSATPKSHLEEIREQMDTGWKPGASSELQRKTSPPAAASLERAVPRAVTAMLKEVIHSASLTRQRHLPASAVAGRACGKRWDRGEGTVAVTGVISHQAANFTFLIFSLVAGCSQILILTMLPLSITSPWRWFPKSEERQGAYAEERLRHCRAKGQTSVTCHKNKL